MISRRSRCVGSESWVAFLRIRPQRRRMKTIRKALRDGDIEKDTYERLLCAVCETSLQTRNDPDELGAVKSCPECGAEYKELRG